MMDKWKKRMPLKTDTKGDMNLRGDANRQELMNHRAQLATQAAGKTMEPEIEQDMAKEHPLRKLSRRSMM